MPPCYNSPQILYKYLDREGAEAFLAKPQLRFTDFRNLNDLFELVPGFELCSEEILDRKARDYVKQHPVAGIQESKQVIFRKALGRIDPRYVSRLLREAIAKLSDPMHICSLSEVSGSVSQWERYAERHTGMVFGINPSTPRFTYEKERTLLPIDYSICRPSFSMAAPTKDIEKIVTTKGKEWEYEKEWRLVTYDSPEPEILKSEEVLEVVFGFHCELDANPQSYPHLSRTKFFRAIPHYGEYRMDILRL